MELELSRLHFPVTTLGPGRRVGIWFQGCSLRCSGCVSVDTWETGRGKTTVDAVMAVIDPWLAQADGVTISGGEPLDQAPALACLLHRIRNMISKGADVLVYSGYPLEIIADEVGAWSGFVDVLISDPFLPSAGQTLAWRGSDNQRMHLLTPLGHSRYGKWVNAQRSALPKAVDVFFERGEVWMAGIPDPGTMTAIRNQLVELGFKAEVSEMSKETPTGD